MAERIGVYPGTFDPITNGHVDIIRRALRICDRLIVAVAENIGKSPLFTLEERLALVNHELGIVNGANGGKAQAKVFGGLLMHFAEENGAVMIIRGLRAVSDFDYEFQMAGMNARLNPDVEMVYLMASEQQQFIASRLVKEIASLGGDIGSFVPPNTAQALRAKFN
ncbi:MAG: pantetheine-phosphate adenylyltransferase [Rhodospirillaceae bacterium]|nr:pantetheine-phosphate adenylyltransferase [Rhodospirillaceae bacterium]MYB11630.1 pantetheine-phosphate adenylyltransferase [Rhodospirillaceae bacterium]MYI49774.1 pantetheine-phosphate adenylyltransferase [Rhodospirillaceae bacterium]